MKHVTATAALALALAVIGAPVLGQMPPTYQLLHGFAGPDGAAPHAAVIADFSGNLFGTTDGDGGFPGTVFKLDSANGYALTTLHSFDVTDGAIAALIMDASGNLYGTTGGLFGVPSTIFRLDAANDYALTTLHSFTGPDGSAVSGPLIADAAGNLYGTTGAGGPNGAGTVFRLDAASGYALTTLHAFAEQDALAGPSAVVADGSGNLYGTTSHGGALDAGTVFKLDAANGYAQTTLHTFDGTDGAFPRSAPIVDAAGNVYGTTSGWLPSGPYTYGTVFKLDAANAYTLTTLHQFSDAGGSFPFASVIADAAGDLYGTTWGGQLGHEASVVFRLESANDWALRILHTFDGEDGFAPSAPLVAGAPGKLFGTTTSGGPGGIGVVFSLTLPVPPFLTSISPTSGPSAGGTAVIIVGTGFLADASVRIGGTAATGAAVVSSSEITALTPPLPPGTLNDVSVLNPGSLPDLPGVLPGGFFSDFLDVPQTDIFHAAVESVFRRGVTAGCGNGSYCSNDPVTRAQAAVFLLKSTLGAAHVPPPCTGALFADVPCTGGPFDPWIEELAALQITAGCAPGLYCPDDAVTREQMAVLLLKARESAAYAPPACAGVFEDVACTPGTGFSDWIEEVARRGITGGCSETPALYCPTEPNSRSQMAAFLTKTFDLVPYGDR
jgi:uncharacterized repeat protein (TIGR03803 family)